MAVFSLKMREFYIPTLHGPNLETQSQNLRSLPPSESVYECMEVLSIRWTFWHSRGMVDVFVRTVQETEGRDVLLVLSQVCFKKLAQQLLMLASQQTSKELVGTLERGQVQRLQLQDSLLSR